MHLTFLDLKRSGEIYRVEVLDHFNRILSTSSFVLGQEVEELEKEIAQYCECRYSVGVASGTDALILSLRAIDVEKGDGVITTPFSFIATASSIVLAGGTPLFVDIDEDTFNISPRRLEEFLRRKAKKGKDYWYMNQNGRIKLKALIPVHLYGQCSDMENIMMIAKEFKLHVIEDTAQALGAECTFNGSTRKAGSIGIAGAISFYPTKNLGGMGDGGMVVTNSRKIAEKIHTLRVHGMGKRKYVHNIIGYNSRLDALQAAGLRVKLKFLDKWNEERIKIADNYRKLFMEKNLTEHIILPDVRKGNKHIYHQFVIRVRKGRDRLRNFLASQGIGTEVYYPLPLHLQPCFKFLGYKSGYMPQAERASKEIIALPIYPGLTLKEQEYVVEKIREYYTPNPTYEKKKT